MGLASYYRKFMKGFSQLAKPLTDLTRDKVAWSWGDLQESSFRALQVAIATAPILRLPDLNDSSLSRQMRVTLLLEPSSNRISGWACSL